MLNPDTATEEPIPIGEIRDIHPSYPSMKTVRRWCRRGLKDSQGEYILLESWREGGERFTTVEAYYRWVQRLNRP